MTKQVSDAIKDGWSWVYSWNFEGKLCRALASKYYVERMPGMRCDHLFPGELEIFQTLELLFKK